MVLTVTPDLTLISDCDAVGNWSDGDVDADWKIQGTGCLAAQVKATTSALFAYTFGSPVDMTGKHIYVWMMVAGRIDTKANGGLRIYVETDGSNYGYWYVVGNETYSGGWICIVIDPASTPTTGLGIVDVSSVAKIGVQFKTLSSVVGQAKNCFWDVCRYGTGLTITSGAADLIDFDDIYAEDNNSSNKYGVVLKERGSYIIQGFLTFGGTGSENVDFVDKNQIVLFPDNEFASNSFYGIKVQCGTGTTNFTLGEKSGDAGIEGCVLKAVGTKKFSFDVSDADIDKMQIYGSTFINAGTITLPPNASNREVISCNFVGCGEVIADTCIVTYCKFVSADDRGVRITDLVNHNITKCDFISCVRGVHCNVAGDVDFDELMFSGNTYDVEFSVSGTLNVSKLNGSNPSSKDESGGGTINYLLSVTLKVIVKDEAGSPIENAQVGIFRQSNMEQLMNEDTLATGIAEETFDYGAGPDVDIYLRIRKSSTGATKYVPISTIGTITMDGFTYYAVLTEDPLA